MKHAKINTDSIVEQTQPIQYRTVTIDGKKVQKAIPVDGFKEVSDDVVCGMVQNGDIFEEPALTQEQIDARVITAKWVTYAEYCSTLTVTAASGNKFEANQEALKSVAFKRDAITDIAEILWVESWNAFTTGKVELQEVISEAGRLMQLKIVELFGV